MQVFFIFFVKQFKIHFLKSILTEPQLEITIKRLAHQVLENYIDLANTVVAQQPFGGARACVTNDKQEASLIFIAG